MRIVYLQPYRTSDRICYMDYQKEYSRLNIAYACFICFVIGVGYLAFYPSELTSIIELFFALIFNVTSFIALPIAIILCIKQEHSSVLKITGIVSLLLVIAFIILGYITKTTEANKFFIITGIIYLLFLSAISFKWFVIDRSRYKEKYLQG